MAMKSLSFSTIQEAVQGTKDSKNGFILFSSPKNIHQLAQQVDSHVVLCSTAGEYTSKGYQNGVISGFSFPIEDAEIVPIQSPPALSKHHLERAYQKVHKNPNSFLLLLCDGLSGMEEKIITTLFFMEEGFKIIGGSAGDDLSFSETPIFIGKERVHSVGVFFNSAQRTCLLKENIYIPSNRELLVTDADPMKRTVKTFNNRPASTEYARMLNVPERELPNYFANHPLGITYGEETYIASPQKINQDKSITFYCQIMPNSFVQILEPIDAPARVQETLGKIPFKPKFLLVINCILRSLKFQQERLWPAIDSKIINCCSNTTGFVSYGEQYYQRHVNQTMVILAEE